MNILILGAGTFGTAIGNELSVNIENHVLLYSRDPDKVKEINQFNTNKYCFPNKYLKKALQATSDKDQIKSADIVFIALPSSVIIKKVSTVTSVNS